MADRPTVENLASLTNETSAIQTINTNVSKLADAVVTKLDITDPNGAYMTVPLNMNGQRLLNLPTPTNPTDVLRLQDVPTLPKGPKGDKGDPGVGLGDPNVIPVTSTKTGKTLPIADYVGIGAYNFDWGWPGLGKPKRDGSASDSAIFNAIVANNAAIQIDPGIVNVKDVGLFSERRGTKIIVPGGQQSVTVQRDLNLVGPTLRLGNPSDITKAAGAIAIGPLFFIHAYRLGYTGTNLPNLLTGTSDDHIQIHGCQGGVIDQPTGIGARRFISVFGGDGLTINNAYYAGGVWDPRNTASQEALAALYFTGSAVHGHGKTIYLNGGNLIGGSEFQRQVTVGGQTYNAYEQCGPRSMLEIESLEYLYLNGMFIGGGAEYGIAVRPTTTTSVLQSIKIANSDIDQSNIANIYTSRASSTYPLLNTMLIQNTEINGVYRSKFAALFDDTGGNRSVRNLKMSNMIARATLGGGYILRGVDGGSADHVDACGYNTAGNRNEVTAGSQNLVSGMYVTSLTRNFRRSYCTWGDDANTTGAGNNCQFGVIDDTASASNNRYSYDQAPYLGMTQGAVRVGGTADTSP